MPLLTGANIFKIQVVHATVLKIICHKYISGYPQGKQTLKTQVLTKSMNISNLVIATLTHYNPLLLFYTP